MHLIRDLLDKQLIDRDGREAGKVDGIVLEMREGRLCVVFLEIGWPALVRRLGESPRRWIERRLGRWEWARIYRLPWARVRTTGRDVKIDLDAEDSTVLTAEQWLREQVISRIPGGTHGKE